MPTDEDPELIATTDGRVPGRRGRATRQRLLECTAELLVATPGVHGARMTGGGFGGCVVALADPGAVELARFGGRALRVEPSDGAIVTVTA